MYAATRHGVSILYAAILTSLVTGCNDGVHIDTTSSTPQQPINTGQPVAPAPTPAPTPVPAPAPTPAGPTDTTPPETRQIQPPQGATSLPLMTRSMTAAFDEDILSTSVNADTFKMLRNNHPIEGDVTFDAITNTATFTASKNLAIGTTYTNKIDGVTDLEGNEITKSWDFTTQSATWKTAEKIETDDSRDAQDPRMARDQAGNIVVLWRQYDGTRDNIWTNRYTLDNGWGTAELLEVENGGIMVSYNVFGDGQGNFRAVWNQLNASNIYRIWTRRYDKDNGWEAPEELNSASEHASSPTFAYDNEGNGIAIWQQVTSANGVELWSRYYHKDTGWQAPQRAENGTGTSQALAPSITFLNNGHAIASWTERASSSTYVKELWANIFDPSTGWKNAENIETGTNTVKPYSQLKSDMEGNAIIAWGQAVDGNNYDVRLWARRFNVTEGWTTPVNLTPGTKGLADSRIDLDVSTHGEAALIWRQVPAQMGHQNIYASVYTPTTGWSSGESLETRNTEANYPKVVVSDGGQVYAAWKQKNDNGFRDIYVATYEPSSGWDTSLTVIGDTTKSASGDDSIHIGLCRQNRLAVIWAEDDGTQDSIWAQHYDE